MPIFHGVCDNERSCALINVRCQRDSMDENGKTRLANLPVGTNDGLCGRFCTRAAC